MIVFDINRFTDEFHITFHTLCCYRVPAESRVFIICAYSRLRNALLSTEVHY